MDLFLDLETFSDVEIRNGTHRYVEGALEVLLSVWAVDDGDVSVAEGWPAELDELVAAADRVVIHNSKFDRTVCDALEIDMPVHKIHDTLVQARSHGLPGGLGALCEVLRVPTDKAKDKAGRELIQLFCKPRPANSGLRRATKETHPDRWAQFIDYARLDIVAMREVFKRMPKWNYGNPTPPNQAVSEREVWLLDQKINDRGFLIDLDLARTAIDAVKAEQKKLSRRMKHLTEGEVEAATQRDKLLKHLVGFFGVDLPDMQKGTLERRVNDENLPGVVRELLAIRLEASGTSTAKYQTLLNATSADGRLRGTLEFCGAARTGRWAGRLFQPQNLPRPRHSLEEIENTIDGLKGGYADLIYTDVIARASSAIRGSLVAPPGKKLVAADLSNIEGRMLAWLAGEEWKLQAFRDFDAGTGHDLYKLAYARSFNLKPEDVTKDGRQLGKVQELALGYQGAVGAFSSMARLYGMDLPEDQVLGLVKAWRAANSRIKSFWYEIERTAITAIQTPGVTREVGKVRLRRDGAWFKIVLPSGRGLVYPNPKIVTGNTCRQCGGTGFITEKRTLKEECPACEGSGKVNDEKPKMTFDGINPYTKKWGRVYTYGGKLVENITQAASRDVMADAMIRAEDAGYEIVLTVHDEIVTETPDTGRFSAEGLAQIMSANPPWAEGLPLAAAGFEAYRYGKE